MGRRVDLDQVSLDMARYAQPDMEAPFVEFLLKRLTKWQPDLVVPIGSPAGRFVNKYRERLFPRTPVIYTGMDRRTLPPDPLPNATFVGESFDLGGLVEDILQLAPDTSNIAVVIGDSPLERYWTREFQRAFEPFSNRVYFTWFNDLSFDQMLERVANMPPKSFLLLGLLIRDASGVTHNQEEALQRLRAVANAPINGIFQHELGLGIVGGRLYQAELQGAESARIAIRVLRGEPVSSFQPRIIPPHAPQYDWRELQRWNIAEHRLPPGSVVKFRQPTTWQRYRWWIAGGLGVVLLQAALIILLGVNLVKRRRVARALRESEQRMDLAVDSAGAGLWSVDLVTRQVWATPRLRELFRFSPDEVLTFERFLTVAAPEDRERVREFFEDAMGRTVALSVEFRIVLPDGSRRWIVTRGQVDGDIPTRASRVSGASVDITERKLAEERLRESESRFRTVANSAPVLIWMSGVDTRCTFFNNSWLQFTGRTAEQEMGDGWTEGVHPDDRPGSLKAYVEAFEARRPFTLQYRLRRHDGEYRWISDHGVPRFDAQGTFEGYIGSCLDITERLRAEERFRQIFEAAPSAMIMAGEDGTIVLVNAQVEKVFGYRPSELVGLPIETLIPERLRQEHPTDRKRFVGDPRARAMGAGRELFGRRKDGGEVPVEIGLNPIRTMEGLFVVASVIDISERQKAEAETQELRQELAHISRVATMGELTAAIVHELAQPLAAILTTAQAGLRLIAAGKHDTDQVREILKDIVGDEERARRVIEHLRSMFQKGEVERRPLLLNQVVNDVVSVVLRDAERRRVAIILDLAPASRWVSGDRIQLQQVLLNLVVNAFDAVSAVDGRPRTVTLRTRALDGDRVQLDVEDSGPGIASDRLGAIFRPFVSSKPGGMGMGLSVSQSIVSAHNGRLWVENGPNGGAVFHVVLPAIGAPEAGAPGTTKV
jgi:PAS domain S-box-containing protein